MPASCHLLNLRLLFRMVLLSILLLFTIFPHSNTNMHAKALSKSEDFQDSTSSLAASATLSAGYEHTCAIVRDGELKCWGKNNHGQLGDGTLTDHTEPATVVGLQRGIVAVSAGGGHTCAITETGGVKCWGSNDSGQLGNSSNVDSSIPVDVVGLSSGVKLIETGWWHTCVVTVSEAVKCWGNWFGDGLENSGSGIPVDIADMGSNVTDISASYRKTCAVTEAGAVKCWEDNDTPPYDVPGLNSGAVDVAVGEEHACAIMTTGNVRCWGRNTYGQFGNGTWADSDIPVEIPNFGSNIIAIDIGALGIGDSPTQYQNLESAQLQDDYYPTYTCVLSSLGEVKCAGAHPEGYRGYTEVIPVTPVIVTGFTGRVRTITSGGFHNCTLTDVGNVYCWGTNGAGQLGYTTVLQSNTPLEVVGIDGIVADIVTAGSLNCVNTTSTRPVCWGGNYGVGIGDDTQFSRFSPTAPIGLENEVAAIFPDENHACALTTSGGVKCWGSNSGGQLGDGTTEARLIPTDVTGLNSGVATIAISSKHSCALTTVGGVKCWGSNENGLLGDGTTEDRLMPTDVIGLNSGVASIAVSSIHSCALTTSGGVKCWGGNFNGNLGDGTTENRLTPINVVGLETGIKSIVLHDNRSCILDNSGAAKCWGRNFNGLLGDGTTENRLVPVNVVGLSSNVAKIVLSYDYSCALTMSGEVRCWGANGDGQLGDGSTLSRPVPVNVLGLNSGIVDVELNHGVFGASTCAVTAASAVKCWGENASGRLGDGTTVNRLTPVDAIGLDANVIAIVLGDSHTCALTSSGNVKCWGNNSEGQLGVNPGWEPADAVDLGGGPRLTAATSCTLQTDADGDGYVSAGDVVRCTATMRNVGDGMAMNTVYRNNLDANVILVTGSVQTSMGNVLRGNSDGDRAIVVNIGNLMPSGSATVQFDLQVNGALPDDIEFIEIPGYIGCDGHPVITPGRPGGAPGIPGIPIGARPIISADKSAILLVDLDGNGIAGPGDTLEYTAVLYNSGTAVAPQSAFVDQLDPNTTLIVGSVTTSQGEVISGNNPGDRSVNVDMGQIAPNASVTIRFKVRINRNLSSTVTQLANLAVCIYPDAPPACVGRPGPYGTCTPSQTPLTSQPLLPATKNGSLYIDADENGIPSPGDTLVYQIHIENMGNAAATNVVVSDQLDANVSLVEGSVRIDREASHALNGALLTINIGRIEPGASVNISFEVQVLDTLPSGTTLLQNQCRISSNELAPFLIGDPGVPLTSGPGTPSVTLPPNVTLTKSSVLITDTGVRNESAGDTLLYLINIVNQSRGVAANVVIEDPLDPNVTLIEASVQTSKGVISIERSGGITTVRVNIGTLNSGESVQIGFRVTINSDAPTQRIVNQCRLTYTDADGNNQNTVLSDDPNTTTPDDPTEALLREGTFLPIIWKPSVCEDVEASPIDVVLVMDRSTSMLDQGKFTAAKLAVSGFLDQMDFSREQAAIASFAATAALDQPLTSDRVVLDAALANLIDAAGTAIGDGLSVATAELQSTRHQATNAPAIILLSDGANNFGSDPITAANNAKAAGIRIFTIGFGSDADAALLQQIATNPDNYFFAPGPDDLAQIYQEIASVVRCTQ